MYWVIKKYDKHDGFLGFVEKVYTDYSTRINRKMYKAEHWSDFNALGVVWLNIADKDKEHKYTICELNSLDIENIARAKLAQEIIDTAEGDEKYGDGYILNSIMSICEDITDEEYWNHRQ